MYLINNIKFCRACLSPIYNGFNIFETLYQLSTNQANHTVEIGVPEVYEQLTGISLNKSEPNHPKHLCFICLEKLFNSYEFFQLCRTSDVELKTKNASVINAIEIVKIGEENTSDGYDHDGALSDTQHGDSFSEGDKEEDPDFNIDTISYEGDIQEELRRNEASKTLDCLQCNKEFNDLATLKKHEKIHEGNWKCPECDKVLTTKYTFRNHMVLHTGKPFQCDICKRKFPRKGELNRHTKIYHQNGKSYQCDECPLNFYTKSHLSSHKISHFKRKNNVQVNGSNNELSSNSRIETSELDQVVDEGKRSPDPGLADLPITIIKYESDDYIISEAVSLAEPSNSEIILPNIPEIENKCSHPPILRNPMFYRCKNCFKKFRLKNNYLRHLKFQKNCKADLNCSSNPQKCPHCDHISDNLVKLRKHLENHLDKNPFKCKPCDKTYKSWFKLHAHTSQIHLLKRKIQSKYICTLCGRGLASHKLLEEHYLAHQGIRNYKCAQCGNSFFTKYGLKQHMSIHTRNPLQCSECSKILSDKAALKNHLALHYGNKFQCGVCEKSFPNRSSLNRHVKGHNAERNFVCDRCSKSYSRECHLKEHIENIHLNPRILNCEECGLEFKHRGTLNKHMRLEHTEKQVFECNECGKSYGRKSRLTEHQQKAHLTKGDAETEGKNEMSWFNEISSSCKTNYE